MMNAKSVKLLAEKRIDRLRRVSLVIIHRQAQGRVALHAAFSRQRRLGPAIDLPDDSLRLHTSALDQPTGWQLRAGIKRAAVGWRL
jgi:hypothetical protein